MKITKSQLKKLIKEEIDAVIKEDETMGGPVSASAYTLSSEEIGEMLDNMRKFAPEKIHDKIKDLTGAQVHDALNGDDPYIHGPAAKVMAGYLERHGKFPGEEDRSEEDDLKEEGNEGSYWDPQQPGGHYDQPKTSNMKLRRQCKEGDEVACRMLADRLKNMQGDK